MSRSKAKTKRRKVWVQFWGSGMPSCVGESRKSVDDFTKREVARFIELRPGDVVLSREEVAGIKRRLAAMEAAGRMGMEAEAQMLSQWIAALLRGGR